MQTQENMPRPEIVMVAGYYIFEGFMYGFAPSIVNIPMNGIQGIAGLAKSVVETIKE